MQGHIVKVEKKVRKRVVRNEVMQGHIVKVEEKSEETRCKNRKILLDRILKVEKKVKTLKRCVVKLGRLCLFGNGKTHLLFRLCLECSHKMEMRYSEEGTLGPLGQRQRYPLPARSLQ